MRDEMAVIPIIQTSWKVVCLTKVFTPKVGPKGQMTLPRDVCRALEIGGGDRVLLRIEPDGKVVLEKAVIMAAGRNRPAYAHLSPAEENTCMDQG